MNALRSGDLASAAGVNRQTLRYYERRGLLPEPDRSLGGHRLYPADTVTRMRAIKAAQRLGFSLDDVAVLLTPRHGLQRRAEGRLAEVDAAIADLELVRDMLRSAIDTGCDDLLNCSNDPRCPLPFDEHAATVSG